MGKMSAVEHRLYAEQTASVPRREVRWWKKITCILAGHDHGVWERDADGKLWVTCPRCGESSKAFPPPPPQDPPPLLSAGV